MSQFAEGDLVEIVKYPGGTDPVVGSKARVAPCRPGVPIRVIMEPEDHQRYWETLPERYRANRHSENDRLEGWLVTRDEIRKVEG